MHKNIIRRTITGLVLGLLFWSALIFLPPIYFSCILGLILLMAAFMILRTIGMCVVLHKLDFGMCKYLHNV